MILALILAVAALACAAFALRPRAGEISGTRAFIADPGLYDLRMRGLAEERIRLEDDLDLQRGVFEVSAELVGCVDEADLVARFAAATGRYWRGRKLEVLVWERGRWRALGGAQPGPPPSFGAPVSLPEGSDGDLVLDLSAAVEGQAALVLRGAQPQPSLERHGTSDRRAVCEVLRGQFALSLRRVALFRGLNELARLDQLTGAYRRWYGEARLAELVESGADVAALMVDIDHFKRVNDSHGHAAGDAVLAAVGRGLVGGVRTEDLVARLGGEEFLVVLPATPLGGAAQVADRLRLAVAALTGLPCPVAVSIGVAVRRDGEAATVLVKRADEALYRAKQGGRNRVEIDR
jgi:diguanylate cyclase (GGDEF)-like protein